MHDDHVAGGLVASPAFGPQIQNVVQIDIGQERRNHRTLPRPSVTDRYGSVFKYARLQPFPDQADDALVTDTMLNEPDEPILADRIEEVSDIGVQNIVHLPRVDRDHQGVKRIVCPTSGSEPIREPEEILLEDGVQHHDGGTLDNLVFQGSNRPAASAVRPPSGYTSGGPVAAGRLLGEYGCAVPRAEARGLSRIPAMSCRPHQGPPCA